MEVGINLNKLLAQTETEMNDKLEKLASEYGVLRTGRATPQLLDGIKVDYYGSMVPLKQVASLGITEGRTIEVRPWEPSVLEDIEKAIQKSELGIPPQNDGKVIRVALPSMTEERRQDMVKIIRKMAEECRVAVRNLRRDYIDKIKKAEKSKELSEDDRSREEDRIQKATDRFIGKVEEVLKAKEKEVQTI